MKRRLFLPVCMALLCYPWTVVAAADEIEKARREMQAFQDAAVKLGEARTSEEAGALQKEIEERLRAARESFEAGKILKSKNSSAIAEYAKALSILGDFDLAAQAIEAALEHDEENAQLWKELGVAYWRAGRWKDDRAVAAFQRCLALDASPGNASEVLTSLGNVYRRQGLFDLARHAYARGMEAKPDEPGPRIGMALLHIRDGKLLEASRAFESLGQGIPTAILGAVKESLADFESSRRVIEDTAENHVAYGKLLLLGRQYGDALLPLRRAATLAPERPEVWSLLGQAHESIRNTASARKAYERSLALNPNQPHVQTAVERLSAGASTR